VASYLLSWLKGKYAGLSRTDFEKQWPGSWIVWEAGPWRPPSLAGTTIIPRDPDGSLPGGGESLAIELQVHAGRSGVTVGRAPENDVVVKDATLSRTHLAFDRGPGGAWRVRDAGSSNGTLLEGSALGTAPVELRSGAALQAGNVRFTYYDPAGLHFRLRGMG